MTRQGETTGFVLVPVVATAAILDAIIDAPKDGTCWALNLWASVLAASPEQPASEAAGVRYRVLPVRGHATKRAVFDVIMGDAIAVCPDEVAANKILAALTERGGLR